MELFPVQPGQMRMSHEEEVAELHPAKCQSRYTWPQAWILFGFCLCKDGGFPGVSGVVCTPWIPNEMPDGCCCSRAGIPCPNLVQGLQSAWSCSGELCPQSPKPSVPLDGLSAPTPVCLLGTGLSRNSLFLEGAPITSTAAQAPEPLE